jgi:UDP-GlcNAc3NAcA epimerase
MLVSVIGTRPNLIKAYAFSKSAEILGVEHRVIDTNQHFDDVMSSKLFEDSKFFDGFTNLKINSIDNPERLTSAIMSISEELTRLNPHGVLVYGDTNSTLAGALACRFSQIKVGHVEAGLRSYNQTMPEEINRVCVDALSDYLFAPTWNALDTLRAEGSTKRAFFAGDLMFDLYLNTRKQLDLNTVRNGVVLTLHRPSNVDDPIRLSLILKTINDLGEPVKILTHPRLKKRMLTNGMDPHNYSNLSFIEPLPYVEMLQLLHNSEIVLTDSGGLQKDAFFTNTPCLTLRNETEWPETIINGQNRLLTEISDLARAIEIQKKVNVSSDKHVEALFGNGAAGKAIIERMMI